MPFSRTSVVLPNLILLQEMRQREEVHAQLAAKAREGLGELAPQGLEEDTGNVLDPADIAQEPAAGQAAATATLPVKRRPPEDRRAIRLGAVSTPAPACCALPLFLPPCHHAKSSNRWRYAAL